MTGAARNRLVGLGIVWGILLAAVPALVMTSPYRLSGFLVAALVCAALSGAVGTLVAGGRARRRVVVGKGKSKVLAGVGTGLFQGLVGGGVAALLIWALMALTLSGFTMSNPVGLSTLMSPRIFLGSFFVSLSVFLYALAGGVVLGPIFGTLANRAAKTGGEA